MITIMIHVALVFVVIDLPRGCLVRGEASSSRDVAPAFQEENDGAYRS